jgi:hypothetical protein
MLKKLLYLYNDGHNPFPHMGRGGLGYHLPGVPKVIHGEGGEGGGYESETDKRLEHTSEMIKLLISEINTHKTPEVKHGDIDDEILMQKAEDVIEGIDERSKLKPKHKKVIEKSIENVSTLVTPETPVVNPEIQTEDINPIYEPIYEYVMSWAGAGNNKRRMTSELKSSYDFTDEQIKNIIVYRSSEDKQGFHEWMKTQTFEENAHEVSEELQEGFIPNYEFEELDKDIIDEIKESELIDEENINDIEEDLLEIVESIQKSDNPFKTFLGNEEYENLSTTYDSEDVSNLLYDNTGEYESGKDFEDKVLKNLDLVKDILATEYGRDRLNMDSIVINYDAEEASGNLFAVFDAHAVSFLLDGKPKEAFIEFKKYSNYSKSISDTETLIKNEEKLFNNFIYNKIDKIQNTNTEILLLKEEGKDTSEKVKELNTLMKQFKTNKDDLMREFYLKLDPVGIGVKYTKFPPLKNFIRPDTSVNTQEVYDFMKKYEMKETKKKGVTSRRKEDNLMAHEKAMKEGIDILIVTGLKNSLLVGNISKLIEDYGGKNAIDFLKLKPTVYSTKQKGTKTIDYDHYNIPFSFFKNVKLNQILKNKSKTKKKTKHIIV